MSRHRVPPGATRAEGVADQNENRRISVNKLIDELATSPSPSPTTMRGCVLPRV
jgi:hypothetical protein